MTERDDTRQQQDPAPAQAVMPSLAAGTRLAGGGVVSALLAASLSIYLLQTAAPVLLPVTLGLLLSMLLWPARRAVARLGLPEPAAAAVILLLVASTILGAVYGLSGPAAEWIRRAPHTLQSVEWKLRDIKRPIEQIQEATKAVSKAASVDEGGDSGNVKVEVSEPGFLELVADAAPAALVQLLVTLVALFFFLAWGDGFMRRLLQLFRDDTRRRRGGRVLHEVRRDVSHYLATITLINTGLGALVSLMLYALGYPNPVLWGVSVALLNFAPFVGSLVALCGLALVGLVSFPTPAPVLAATLGFGLLTVIEGYFVTPAVLGRRLSLDPLAIFLSLLLWGWLWNAVGLLMAVPLLVCARIVWVNVGELARGSPGDAPERAEPEPVA